MPSTDHELPLKLFQKRPSLAPEILKRVFGLELPDIEAEEVTLGSETFTTSGDFTTRMVDRTILLGKSSSPDWALLIESQLKKDVEKRFRWPLYIAHAHDLWKCPTVLLIVTPDEKTARWCRKPIDLGHPSLILKPLVVSHSNTPQITDPEDAHNHPELAILSGCAQTGRTFNEAVLKVIPNALAGADEKDRSEYYDFVRSALSGAAKDYLEAIMATSTPYYQYKTDWLRDAQVKGKAEGKSNDIITVLETRGLPVNDETRERITSCTDLDQLTEWLRRAVRVEKTDELFQ
jgi:hypothetical protein